ncbi:hypothetical protein LINPERHAP1_LOCUS8431, partial [Linum perenne]
MDRVSISPNSGFDPPTRLQLNGNNLGLKA